MNIDKIGERLKQLRLQNGFTQDDVGRKINVTKQTLYKYENAIITNIPLDKIRTLARIYNTTPQYLLGLEDSSFKNISEMKKTFSMNFNRLLKNHNKTQKEISVALGYPQATISDWSRGVKYPSMDRVGEIAQYFNVPISDLIEEKSESQELSKKDENDIAIIIEKMRKRLTQGNLIFEGKPVTPENIQSILTALQIGMEMARKQMNEEDQLK